MNRKSIKLGQHCFVTKLAGFEHSKYIQHNATHTINEIPLIQGKNIKDGRIIYSFDWYISKEISDALPRSVLNKRCIVIPYVGSKLGELAIFENYFRCHLASNVAKVELTDGIIDLDYLFYYLKSPFGQSQLFKDKQGSAQPNITMEAIRETIVHIFDIKTQQKVASVLSSLDDKIELNNRINAELEAMGKLIYDYYFVQFDFPNEKGKPYKSSGGKMVWNEELKREIPEGWEVSKLENYIDRIIDYRGKTPKKLNKEWSENPNDIIALSAKNVKNGQLVNLSEANRVDEELYNTWMQDKLNEGDILMTSEAPCGEFFYLIGKHKFCLSQRLFSIRANEEKVKSSYLYYELSKGNGYSQIIGKQSGSTVYPSR
jgi:type I restriction enzyme, S subunit